MKRKTMFRIAVIACAVAGFVMFATPAAAATSVPMTVTATPAYIALTNAPDAWTLNGLTGTGTVANNTVYWSNPLGDTTSPSSTVLATECAFTITNTSTVTTDVYINIADFSGGSAASTNSNDGTNTGTTFGAYTYCTGMAIASKVLCKTSGSAVTKASLAPTTDLKWGMWIKTQATAWTGGTSSNSVVTISLAAH